MNYNSLNKLIENSIRNGVNYFVVLGTTAESTSLSIKEQNDIINFVIKIVNKRAPIVLGLGGNNTSKILERINEINFDEILQYYQFPILLLNLHKREFINIIVK